MTSEEIKQLYLEFEQSEKEFEQTENELREYGNIRDEHCLDRYLALKSGKSIRNLLKCTDHVLNFEKRGDI